ncbi:MAG: LicD family protein [Romboutsia sp.]|nr:LicD family protein [Romboutsia sp.]
MELSSREIFGGFLLFIIIYASLKRNYIEYFDSSLDNNHDNIIDQRGGDYNSYRSILHNQDNRTVQDPHEKQLIEKSKKDDMMRRYSEYKQRIYTAILADSKEALDELEIPFFLSSGTCLGYFREDKFIDHDYDIDLGIFEQDYRPELIDKMAERGLHLYRVLGTRKDGMELSFKKKGTKLGHYAKVDIFLHYLEKEERENEEDKEYCSWYSYKAPQFEEKIKYRVGKFDIIPVKFMGLIVNVPHPTLRYILDHYGEDWLIPKKAGVDYYYATSPKSIQE